MIERLLSFADPTGVAYGAIAVRPGGERGAAFAETGSGPLTLSDVEISRGEGAITARGAEGAVVLGLAAQTSPLGFETADGAKVSVQAVGVSGDLGSGSIEGIGVAWAFEGEQGLSVLRTAWAALEDGSLLLLFATRPDGADDHAAESTGCARIARDGSVTNYAEPLLSTEYDGTGLHTRATLELWGEDEDGLPDRGAGRRIDGGGAEIGAGTLQAARFGWRVGGVPAIGAYEILTA